MDKGIITINNRNIEVLLAISELEQEHGLMYIDPPVPNMAFLYDRPKINKFWMKATKAPLDIIFCLNNKITSICSGIPYSTSIIGNDAPSDLVIELPAKTCEAYGIKIGDVIHSKLPDNALMKMFMLKSGILI